MASPGGLAADLLTLLSGEKVGRHGAPGVAVLIGIGHPSGDLMDFRRRGLIGIGHFCGGLLDVKRRGTDTVRLGLFNGNRHLLIRKRKEVLPMVVEETADALTHGLTKCLLDSIAERFAILGAIGPSHRHLASCQPIPNDAVLTRNRAMQRREIAS